MSISHDAAAASGSAGRRSVHPSNLVRGLGPLGLVATALSAMVGVGVNILPFMVQRSEPGVGGLVPVAYVLATIPAALAAFCYAVLSSAMPRAGGSYVYATRALDPLVGFLASFAQWFGLSMGMGVVAYLLVPMIRDVVGTAGWPELAPAFDQGPVRVTIALAAIWTFWAANVAGVQSYQRTVVVLVAAMIVGPIIMTIVGFANTPADYERALAAARIALPPAAPLPEFTTGAFLATCVVLFSSFIGFDAIAQAGGEARSVKDLPRSIVISLVSVSIYYVLFTAAVYHAVPWSHIYRASLVQDISAPGLLAPLMPRWMALVLLLAVTSAVLNSIISVMLANSRMLYAFAADRLFPAALARIHPRYRTPHHAITITAIAGSLSVIGCHLARDFFLGVDLLILSMLMNFILMAAAVLTLPRVNPGLYRSVDFLKSRQAQVIVAVLALVLLGALLLIQIVTDVTSAAPWYFKATLLWIAVVLAAAVVFRWYWRALEREGIDPRAEIFSELPAE